MSGSGADNICNSMGFKSWVCVEAIGFSGGIWVFGRGMQMLLSRPLTPSSCLCVFQKRMATSGTLPLFMLAPLKRYVGSSGLLFIRAISAFTGIGWLWETLMLSRIARK